jgi:hypothetical protein
MSVIYIEIIDTFTPGNRGCVGYVVVLMERAFMNRPTTSTA